MLTSYYTRLQKRLKPPGRRGAKKVHSVKRIIGDGGFIKMKSFSGGPELLFYDSLIMNAAHLDFTEH